MSGDETSAPLDMVPTPEQAEALEIARSLIAAGVPVFSAKPCPVTRGDECTTPGACIGKEYHLPPKWQLTVPSAVWLERWSPGDALAIVGGHKLDVLDIDPRNGGDESAREMRAAGQWPREFGTQTTPSGGRHVLISPTGEKETNGFMPGLDLQSGAPDGSGRAFAFIAPTVKKSKAPETLGRRDAYRWVTPPDLEMLAEFAGSDDSIEGVRTRVAARRSGTQARSEAVRTADPYTGAEAALFGGAAHEGPRLFTVAQAQEFCRDALLRLQSARVGEIEERCNAAAAQLSHFVPAIWSADEAMEVLRYNLAETDYDPTHPASAWTVDKFRPVLDGTRPPLDPWKAELRTDMPAALAPLPEPTGDDVDALLAEMLRPGEIAARPSPRYLIRTLINFNSLCWVIGAPGSKKSFVVLDLAAHVANGQAWQGLDVHQARVVIIAAEGAGGLSKRIRAWEKTYGPMGDEVYILPRPVQAGDRGAWSVLVQACARLQPGLVVLDTQARVTVGMEENSAMDMGIFIAAANAIEAATGACVLPVHHTGRNGGDARGSSALDGAQDTELKVVAKDGLTGELRVEKQKDLEQRAPLPLTFLRVDLGTDDEGHPEDSLVLAADPYLSAERAGMEMPEEWETGHAAVIVHLFKVLRDQGGTTGLTKAEARMAVLERFYGGDVKRLKKTTWYTGWSRGQEKHAADGDPVMINVSGEKWTVDPEALARLDRPGDVS